MSNVLSRADLLSGGPKAFYYVSIGFLFSQLFPPLLAFVPIGMSVYLLGYVLLAVILVPKLVATKPVLWLTVFYLIMLCKFIFGNAYVPRINEVVIPYLSILSPYIFASFVLQYIDEKRCKFLIIFSALLLTVFSLTSIRILLSNPLLMRQIFSDAENAAVSPLLYRYGDVHQMVVLVLPLCFFFKNVKGLNTSRWISLSVLAIIVILMAVSNAGTAMIIGVFCVFIGFVSNQDKISPRRFVGLIVIAIILYVLNKTGVIIMFLDFVKELLPGGGTTAERIDEIELLLQTGNSEGDLAGRQDLYSDSWKLFLESPLSGTSRPELIGRHAYFIDILACNGVFLILPYIVFFVKAIKTTFYKLGASRFTYLYGSMAYIFILFTKNQMGFFYLFGLLPLFCKYIDFVINDKKIKSN